MIGNAKTIGNHEPPRETAFCLKRKKIWVENSSNGGGNMPEPMVKKERRLPKEPPEPN
jgi:hypothetical protein